MKIGSWRVQRRFFVFIAVVLLGAGYMFVGSEISRIQGFFESDQQRFSQADTSVLVAERPHPYAVSVEKEDSILFENGRDRDIRIVFETRGIDEISLSGESAALLDLSKYDSLPEKNYYSVHWSGESQAEGQIVVQ